MKKRLLLIISILLLLTSTTVFAGDKPLSLKSSIPENGAINVAVESEIVLTFSNNVVNMKVLENNKECFSLLDAAGNEVEMEVYFPDDQIEPENKRIISLRPSGPLTAGTDYTVVISQELKSKNGSKLGDETQIQFRTAE